MGYSFFGLFAHSADIHRLPWTRARLSNGLLGNKGVIVGDIQTLLEGTHNLP